MWSWQVVSNTGDQLLMLVSARRRLTWDAFRRSFDVLHAQALRAGTGVEDSVPYVRQKSLRFLSELAHCELPPFGGGTAVCVAPTVLARLPAAGLPVATLCGSRSAGTAAVLRSACSRFGSEARVLTVTQRTAGGYAPSPLRVEVTDEQLLEDVAAAAGLQFARVPPAWALLQFSASVADYEAGLGWTSDPDPVWPRRDFDATSFTFRLEPNEGRYRLSSFRDPRTSRYIHRFWRDGAAATVDRTWGRWLYLKAMNVQALRIDPQLQAVTVPATVPLPGLLARALALFSGLAPHQSSDPERPEITTDSYTNVSLEATAMLAEKLSQQLVTVEAE
jgi:hypothetical protein